MEFESQSFVIDAKSTEHRGMEVVNVDWILGDVVAVVVGRTVGCPPGRPVPVEIIATNVGRSSFIEPRP